jgi:hypothetical protein
MILSAHEKDRYRRRAPPDRQRLSVAARRALRGARAQPPGSRRRPYAIRGQLGEETLRPGDCAAFKAGDPNGHHFVNRTDRDAVLLEVGNSDEARDRTVYSDLDMVAEPGVGYVRRDGSKF